MKEKIIRVILENYFHICYTKMSLAYTNPEYESLENILFSQQPPQRVQQHIPIINFSNQHKSKWASKLGPPPTRRPPPPPQTPPCIIQHRQKKTPTLPLYQNINMLNQQQPNYYSNNTTSESITESSFQINSTSNSHLVSNVFFGYCYCYTLQLMS